MGVKTEGTASDKSAAPIEGAANSGQHRDVWSDWLLHIRHAGDEEYRALVESAVTRVADRLVLLAQLSATSVLLDVGTGDGLLAFRAIERTGPSLKVLMADVSVPLLQHTKLRAESRGFADQCEFIQCSADNLTGIPDGTVDVVMTRAVLAYVANKTAAFREFHRVLKPRGRIVLCEPILQDDAFFVRALRQRLASSSPPPDRFSTLLHRWKSAQFPDTEEACARSPITNFSERDLLNQASAAGFSDLHLELHIDVAKSMISSWDVFVGTSPHPLAPTLAQILAERFSPDEREYFERHLRPIVESGAGQTVERVAYLTALKPSASS